MKVLIVGCGYVGTALGLYWQKQGHAVSGWVRSEASARHLQSLALEPFIGDLSLAEDWLKIPHDYEVVVHCASSGHGGADSYRSVYLEGLRLAGQKLPKARLLFTSSTSVYGQIDGSEVSEESPAIPGTETSQILREAEELGLRHGAIVLRIAGIYGPDRGVLFRRFLEGQALIEGDGTRTINQIHRDDIVTAINYLLHTGQPGNIYNVVDDHPCTYLEFYHWLSAQYQRPFPPFGPVDPQRKRGLTNKRVLNTKLKSLGWSPLYPSFREGLGIVGGS